MEHDDSQTSPPGRTTVAHWVFAAFLGIAAYLLFIEHRAHLDGLLGYLPYLFLLACPLLHVFMHRGHRHHAPGRPVGESDARRPQ